MLQDFHIKIDNISYKLCKVYNKQILYLSSMLIIQKTCKCCYSEKSISKKFSKENDIDPRDMSNELKLLTEIEQILIA